MKKIKIVVLSLFFVFAFTFLLTSCDEKLKATSYYLDDNGNLIVSYDNGTEADLGKWNENIISSLKAINISDDGYYIIDGVKTKIALNDAYVKGVSKIEISEDGYYVVNGVKTGIEAIEVYTVKFNTGYSAKVDDQKIKDGYRINKPTLDRAGYQFEGWFYNDEEWVFNTDTVKNDMTLTAKWTALTYTVKFVNDKGTNPNDEVYTFGSNITLPTVKNVAGYTFEGWYNNNTKVPNGAWNIAEDVTLTAKWAANSYTITINPNGGTVSSTSMTVKYGENYTLPVPTNSFGAFKGWSYEGVQLTDSQGKSLAPFNYASNITVTTNWIEEISTVDQLKAISTGLNGHYKLVADIDLENEEWTPIGDTANPFTGVFDGDGFKLKNLAITEIDGTEVALFGCSSGTIKNVILEDVNINLGVINSNTYVASLVANNKGTIDNVVSLNGTVKVANHSATLTSYAAGIVAKNTGSLKNIENGISASGGTYTGGVCAYDESTDSNLAGVKLINNGTIVGLQVAGGVYAYSKQKNFFYMKNTGSVTAVNNAGGIVGVNTAIINKPVWFKYCANTGSIKSTDNNHGTSYAGGLTSDAREVNVSDSYNTGVISGYYKGGLLGYNIGTGTYTRCLNTASCQYGFANYMGSGSTIYDSMDYGTSNYATGYATVTNSYHSNPSDFSFYQNTLFWSDEIWDFSGTTYPTLKWESE